MDTSNTRIRRIVLDGQEYSFPFDNPSGAHVKCTVTEGEGTVALYRVKRNGDKSQIGEDQVLSLRKGESFYVSLNTNGKSSKWEVTFRGKGTFKLELPDELLYNKRVLKKQLPAGEYSRNGKKKEQTN